MINEINKQDSREAMGLPKRFVDSSITSDELVRKYNEFKIRDKNELVDILESQSYSNVERYVAGSILAVTGDPRINSHNPKMLMIKEHNAEIGINKENVNVVFEKFKYLGISREWIEKESPTFNIHIKAFKLSKYLVTNKEYYDFLVDTDYSEIPTSWEFGIYPIFKSNHPVYTITEKASDAYVKWLKKKTGRKFRLPTEYEWEYAASGDLHFEYPWGKEFKTNMCNTVETGIYSSTPVGMFSKGDSSFGVSDMAGNVEEYVSDNYHIYPGGVEVVDDLGGVESYRVARGGSFTRYCDLARTTRRHGKYGKDIYVMGFRLAEDI